MITRGSQENTPPRRFWANRNDEYKGWICLELTANLAQLRTAFLNSIELFAGSGCYTAFRVDEVHDDGRRTRYGGGLLAVYLLPFTNESALGVEAAWFRDDDPVAHAFIWQYLVNEAVDAGLKGLCVSPATISHRPSSPNADVPHNKFGVFRNKHLLMAGQLDGVWSAFVNVANRKPQFVDCLRVVPQIGINLHGAVYSSIEPLFRGEGRINRGPYQGCHTLKEVAQHAFKYGFAARGTGGFGGTYQEQILHQGYVSSPTISMTAEFDIGVYYGTSAGRVDQALVFEIDPERLRQTGPIWDTFRSMTAGSMAFLETDFEIVVKLVRGISDLREAGSLIERLDTGIRELRKTYHETLEGTSKDYERVVGAETWARALKVLTPDELMQLCDFIENFFHWFETPEGVVASSGYVAGFLLVRDQLEKTLQVAAPAQWQYSGWDNTVFGYVVKTSRDREYLSSGPVPGECIRAAHLVDANGQRLAVYSPSRP